MVCIVKCVSARRCTAVAKPPGRALILREELSTTAPSSVSSTATARFGVRVAISLGLGLVVIHIDIKAIVVITVPTPAQFPIVEPTSPIVPIA
jgi:hypothetical protein